MLVLPEERPGRGPVEFSTAAFIAILLVVAGILGATTALSEWIVAAIGLAVATLVERTGQWWYGRERAGRGGQA